MNDEASASLLRLEDSERARLGQALRILLDRGSILGSESPHADLYLWSFANLPWMEEMAALFDLQLFWEHESRLVQAVPRSAAFRLRLRLDATLVLMTLWYEFDTAVRDRGETPPVTLSAEQLNDSLDAKFRPLRKAMPSHTRLVEILRLAQRKNLIRFAAAIEPARTRIDILPTIKRVIPFQNIEDWTRQANRFVAGANGADVAQPNADETTDESDAEREGEERRLKPIEQLVGEVQRAWREQFENPVPLYKQLAQVGELPSLEAKLATNIERLKLIDRAKFDEWETQRQALEHELKTWEAEQRTLLTNQKHKEVERAASALKSASEESAKAKEGFEKIKGSQDFSVWTNRLSELRETMVEATLSAAAVSAQFG